MGPAAACILPAGARTGYPTTGGGKRVWRPLIRLSRLAIEGASENPFSAKPRWTALCERLRRVTLSQV